MIIVKSIELELNSPNVLKTELPFEASQYSFDKSNLSFIR